MRTQNKVAYKTKTRALLVATILLWLGLTFASYLYFAPLEHSSLTYGAPMGEARASFSSGYLLFCGLFFIASLLISWFCNTQDRLDDDPANHLDNSGTKL